jgi:hypothetical protein
MRGAAKDSIKGTISKGAALTTDSRFTAERCWAFFQGLKEAFRNLTF